VVHSPGPQPQEFQPRLQARTPPRIQRHTAGHLPRWEPRKTPGLEKQCQTQSAQVLTVGHFHSTDPKAKSTGMVLGREFVPFKN
jgi:hypothetical protein